MSKHRGFAHRILIALAMSGALIPFSSEALASRMSDWGCLTQGMAGSDQARKAYIQAASEASRLFDIAPSVLVGIKRTESGMGLNPMVTGQNRDGSKDRGYFQVNNRTWLPELNRIGLEISEHDLHGVRANALIAAWILRRQMTRHSDPLTAVGYYHKGGGKDSRSDNIRKVYKQKFMKHMRVLLQQCGGSTLVTAAR